MRLTRLTILFTLLFALTLPLFAQTIDPTADLDETYTLGALTLNYPTGMSVSDDGYQIFLVFDVDADDYISIATPESFDYFGVPRDTLDIAAQNVYQSYVDATGTTDNFADAITQTTIGGYEAYLFELNIEGFNIVTYAFLLNDAPYVITLFSTESAMPLADEMVIMTRIVESMVVAEVSAETTSVFTEVTPQVTPEVTAEPLTIIPRDVPAGASDVLLDKEVVFVDGEIAFSIPESWTVDEAFTLVGTTDNLLDVLNGDVEIGADEFAIQFLVPSRVRYLEISPINLDSLLMNVVAQFENPPIYEYTDWDAYYIPVSEITTDDAPNVPKGAFFMVVQIGDADADILVLIGIADNFDAIEPTVIAIINSIVYTYTIQPEATQDVDTGASPEVTPTPSAP